MILPAIIAMQQVRNADFDEKRNFSLNIIAKVSDIPAKEAYPAIMISSCSNAKEPVISLTDARYIPPES